jgi:methyltransferase family protein
MDELSPMLQNVEKYYSEKIATHGRTPQGADWKSAESQTIRFDQLLRLIRPDGLFTINDYGCGYGALVDYLKNRNHHFTYRGFDVSEKMITEARQGHEQDSHCEFFSEKSLLSRADYTVASGIFNVKLDTPESEWLEYILATLKEFRGLSRKGFAFNALTSYSDPKFMRSDLFYANPLYLFDYCQKNFSRMVSLLRDYPLYEFTIVVRFPGGAD